MALNTGIPNACLSSELTSSGLATPSATTKRDSRLIAAQILCRQYGHFPRGMGLPIGDQTDGFLSAVGKHGSQCRIAVLTRDMVPIRAFYSPPATMVQSARRFQHAA